MIGKLEEALQRLTSGPGCWGVTAGKGTGSMVTIDCGAKIPRRRMLSNPFLQPEVAENEAECSLFLLDCAWRVMKHGRMMASSLSSNDRGGSMLSGLAQMVGQRITGVELDPTSLDLKLAFENGISLEIFCLGEAGEREEENYSYYTPDGVYTVDFCGNVRVEKRSNRDAGEGERLS